MYHNVHMPVISLDKAPVKTSGLCSVRYFRHEDVLSWPVVHPVFGTMMTALELKPDTNLYFAEAIDSFRSFNEKQKDSQAGISFDITVDAALKGSSAANILTLQTMIYHQWGILVEDRNGVTRLIGNQDSGANLVENYTSGDRNSSRKTELQWLWSHPNPAPVYSAAAFDIIIGGVVITAGCLKLIKRFRVGAGGAPMIEGDINYTNAAFANKNLLVIAGGMVLPLDDGTGAIDWSTSIERHIYKQLASDTIQFIGSVITNEIIEIYAWT